MKKKISALLMMVLCMALLCSCSSNAAEHASTFFRQMKIVINTATTSAAKIAAAEAGTEEEDENALSKPANFTVDEDGNISFDAVDGAVSYTVSIYENGKTKTSSYSLSIDEDGSSNYATSVDDILATGATTDWFGNVVEADPLTYGTWSIRVCAVPDYENTDNTASSEAKAEYVVTGSVEYGEIEFCSMWNVFANELTIQVSGMACSKTLYPDEIIVTLTNTADSGDVVTISVTDVSSTTIEAVTTEATLDATYDVSAEFIWDADYVTNPEYSCGGGSAETSSTMNLVTGDFYYVDAIYYSFGFPHVTLSFDPVNGGEVGVWYKEATTDDDGTVTDNNAYFEATPIEAADGALYSYDIVITSPAGKIYATPYTDSGKGSEIIWGQMDIYADGTFTIELEYQYILTDLISSGVFYIPGAICEGSYSVNADGTLLLNFDHTNCYESDYEIITALTGKAAEYAVDHPDFEQVFEMPAGWG